MTVVDSHPLVAEALELALSLQRFDARLVPKPASPFAPEALTAAILRTQPEIVLLGLGLEPTDEGLHLVAPLVGAGVDVVVLTSTTDLSRWGEALRRGTRIVFPMSGPLNELMSIVRRLSRGQRVLDVQEREALMQLSVPHDAQVEALRERFQRLSRREAQVLEHLMAGRTVQEIAAHETVAEGTVRTHVKSILAKLQVSSQVAAVALAHQVARHRTPEKLAATAAPPRAGRIGLQERA